MKSEFDDSFYFKLQDTLFIRFGLGLSALRLVA